MEFLWQYSKLFSIILISILLTHIVSKEARMRLFPLGFASLIVVSVAAPFLPSAFSYVVMGATYLLNAFLLNLDVTRLPKMSSAEKFFYLFYCYHMLSNTFAPFAAYGVHAKTMAFFSYFFAGIMAGHFCVANDQFKRLSKWVSLLGVIVLVIYRRNAFAEVDLEAGERLGVEDVLNANLAGLHLVSLMPFLLFTTFIFKEQRWAKAVAALVWGGVSVLLFLTGSRNAFLGGMAALLGTVLLVTRNRLLSMVGCLAGLGAIGLALSKIVLIKDSRLFDFTDATGSGRMNAWEFWLEDRTQVHRFFGSGPFYDMDSGIPRWANMHSIYVQMYYEIGYFGLTLFVLYLLAHVMCALRLGRQGRISLVLLVCCLVSGVGESYPIASGSLLTLLWGLSIGLLIVPPKQPQSLRPFGQRASVGGQGALPVHMSVRG